MFECQICKITTSTVFNYRAHLTSKKHISNLEKINSKAVDTINNNPQDLILDIQLHNQTKTSLLLTSDIYNKKATKFVCTCCNKSFASNFSLKRHVNKTELAQKLISNTDNINSIADILNKSSSQLTGNVTIIVNNNTINNTLNGDVNINVGNPTKDEIYDNFINYWKIMGSNPFGFEDTKMLEDKNVYNDVHANGLKAYKAYIKHVYSNAANHNVALYNKREKLCKYLINIS